MARGTIVVPALVPCRHARVPMLNPSLDPTDSTSPVSEGVIAHLSEHLHFAVVDEDVIVLDARTDAYSCLPGAGAVIQVDGARIVAPADVIAQLGQAGFLGDPGPKRAAAPPAPRRSLSLPGSSATDVFAAGRFWWAWWREGRNFETRSLADLLATARRRPSAATVSDAELARLTSTFVRLLPWAPGQGACLYRAHLLRALIRDAGGEVQWVFGVRTWPFSAHCWLQVGDTVLDDEPDRVGVYTPIMVV
ncbi:MAG: lasso peptide biosynthesis B2 protein [Brevundimonas sp.]|jgi:Transglutaminase-like superfamily|nr:MAG: lasso peptide biosynthesis B2 protein [Brevundimonas sp.]